MLRIIMIGIILISCGIVEPESGIETVGSRHLIEKTNPVVMPPHPRLLMMSIRTGKARIGDEHVLVAYLYSPVKRSIIVAFVDNYNVSDGVAGERRIIATKKLLFKGNSKVEIAVSEFPNNWGIIIWENT